MVSPTYEGEESVEMVWVWIIVVIIVIALIIWWLVSRRKRAQSSGGHSSVGRHVASSERTGAPGGAGDAASTDGAAGQPVFDQEAHPQEVPAVDATEGAEAPMVPAPAPQATPAAEPSVDPHDAPTQAVPAVETQQATETTGEAAVPTNGEAAAVPGGSTDAPSGADGPAQEQEVRHTTGSTGEEQLVASGSPSNDDPQRADADAMVAAENDDPQVRGADAPAESAADAARHSDAELADTPVERPTEGTVGTGGPAAGAVAAGTGDDAPAAASASPAVGDAGAGKPSDQAVAESSSDAPTSAGAASTLAGQQEQADQPTSEQAMSEDAASDSSSADSSHAGAAAAAVGGAAVVGGGAAAVAAAHHDDKQPAAAGGPATAAAPAGTGDDARAAAPTGEAGHAPTGADPMTERFGEGAASPRPDGSAPEGHSIKGNADSMLFHTPDSPRYDATSPAVWFKDESTATAAGFAHWDRTKRSGATAAPAATPAPDAPAPETPARQTPAPAAASGPAAAPEPAVTDAPAPETPRTPGSVPAPTAEPEQRETASSPSDGGNAPSVGEEAVTRGDGAGGEGAATAGGAAQAGAPDPMQEQFGPGAASPREDGSAPTERHTIKGNADSMLFHTADSPHYERTEAEVWFTDEEAAKAAGFKHWDHRKR